MSEILTHEEAAQALGCSMETLAHLLRVGVVPATQDGRSYVIPRAAFMQRLNERALEEAKRRSSGVFMQVAPTLPVDSRRKPLAVVS